MQKHAGKPASSEYLRRVRTSRSSGQGQEVKVTGAKGSNSRAYSKFEHHPHPLGYTLKM